MDRILNRFALRGFGKPRVEETVQQKLVRETLGDSIGMSQISWEDARTKGFDAASVRDLVAQVGNLIYSKQKNLNYSETKVLAAAREVVETTIARMRLRSRPSN